MNFRNSVSNLSTKFNLACRIYKPVGKDVQFRSNLLNYETLLEDKNHLQKILTVKNNSLISNVNSKEKRRFSCAFPVKDLPVLKKIIEPEKSIKVNIETPIMNIIQKEVDLPCLIDKDLVEPTKNIISKKTLNMFRIRKKKMRKHKYKKFMKKMKFVIAKKKLERKHQKETLFTLQMRDILKQGKEFCAASYVTETLKTVNWEKPVTKAKGRLAPQWVIKQEAEKEAFKKDIMERIEEISKMVK